jgi:hypothetical protein
MHYYGWFFCYSRKEQSYIEITYKKHSHLTHTTAMDDVRNFPKRVDRKFSYKIWRLSILGIFLLIATEMSVVPNKKYF